MGKILRKEWGNSLGIYVLATWPYPREKKKPFSIFKIGSGLTLDQSVTRTCLPHSHKQGKLELLYDYISEAWLPGPSERVLFCKTEKMVHKIFTLRGKERL
jgi:hypothetical protein